MVLHQHASSAFETLLEFRGEALLPLKIFSHLLLGLSFGLWDQESEEDGASTSNGAEEKVAGGGRMECLLKGGDEGHHYVGTQPTEGSGDGSSQGSCFILKEFHIKDPRYWTQATASEEDEEHEA